MSKNPDRKRTERANSNVLPPDTMARSAAMLVEADASKFAARKPRGADRLNRLSEIQIALLEVRRADAQCDGVA